eukprot:4943439-Pleurochrysis_carterae.AAC.1
MSSIQQCFHKTVAYICNHAPHLAGWMLCANLKLERVKAEHIACKRVHTRLLRRPRAVLAART